MSAFDRLVDSLLIIEIVQRTSETRWDVLKKMLEEVKRDRDKGATMDSFLFFDTETTGVPKSYMAPLADLNNWPRLVQLGYIYVQGDVTESVETVVKPEGFEIPPTATALHGITNSYAAVCGVPLDEVLDEFAARVAKSTILVGHNLSFDMNVVAVEYLRLNKQPPFQGKVTCDTMLAGTSFCGIPGPFGFKWPKLSELYERLFGKPLDQKHTALSDIQVTRECFFEMVKRGIIKITP